MQADRRSFLKSVAAAAVAAAPFKSDKVNLAFIGMGRKGSSNLNYAAKTPGFEVTAVCDVDQAALDGAAAQAKKPGFREILADRTVDAVCIEVPGRWRAYLTVEACKAGKDVWVETPVCVSMEEGVKMVDAARKYQRVVQAGTVHRSSGVLRKVREMVKSGGLGEVAFCRASQSDWDVHPIDTVQFAFDEAMPLSVAAQGEVPGAMLATCRYPGFIASYESHMAKAYSISFHGTKATLTLDRDGYRLYRNEKNAAPIEERSESLAAMSLRHWANFLECIHSRRKPASDIETCVRSTTTCLLADLALRRFS